MTSSVPLIFVLPVMVFSGVVLISVVCWAIGAALPDVGMSDTNTVKMVSATKVETVFSKPMRAFMLTSMLVSVAIDLFMALFLSVAVNFMVRVGGAGCSCSAI